MKKTFPEYCKARFTTAREGAELFGLDQSSYDKYMQYVRFPRTNRLEHILRNSEGQICVEKWMTAFNQKRESRKNPVGGKA